MLIGGGRHYYLEVPAVLGGRRCPINYGPRGRGKAENELIAEQNSGPLVVSWFVRRTSRA